MVERQDTRRGTSGSPQFDAVIEQFHGDHRWRRQVAAVHLRHRTSLVLSWLLHGFAELGCWFTVVPPQRCTARPVPGATRRTA